jgi:hypothetical protein
MLLRIILRLMIIQINGSNKWKYQKRIINQNNGLNKWIIRKRKILI